MSIIFGWVLQILIFSLGIFFFLRFVRSTRGSRLIRGLVVSVMVGLLGLWSLAKVLDLEELRYILQNITGFLAVIFVILFQPELRRGIAQLGEHQLIGRYRRRLREDALGEVVKALAAMAARRCGALIAFEREAPLSAYIEGGVRVDSGVNRLLLESIFQPGGALHDGAVILRKDRIMSACSLFPLTKNPEFSRLRGTRHRAALGLSEETDAVTVAVSEETGAISICINGSMQHDVLPSRLGNILRKAVGVDEDEPAAKRPGWAAALWRVLSEDPLWLGVSTVLACGIMYVAHQDLSSTRLFPVNLLQQPADSALANVDAALMVVLPDEDLKLVSPKPDKQFQVAVTGTRAQLDELGTSLGGVLDLSDVSAEGGFLSLSDVRWSNSVPGLRFEWNSDSPPTYSVESFIERNVDLSPELVVVDATRLDPRYEAKPQSITFGRNSITLVGPTRVMGQIEAGELGLRLESIVLSEVDRNDRRDMLDLHASLRELDVSIKDSQRVAVTLPIVTVDYQVASFTKEVALVSLNPELAGELERWRLPPHAQTARFTVLSSGLLPVTTDPDAPGVVERRAAILRFVEENLWVFVDVSERQVAGRSVPIRWHWRRDWRESLESLGLDRGTLGGRETLNVRLDSEPVALLDEHPSEAGGEDLGPDNSRAQKSPVETRTGEEYREQPTSSADPIEDQGSNGESSLDAGDSETNR